MDHESSNLPERGLGERFRAEWARPRDGSRSWWAELPNELDDKTYDQYLYATGRPNRVVVRDVIDHSNASAVGIRPRDVILQYDGRRIFSPENLNEATTLSTLGENVAIEVLRNGKRLRLDVPSGPLGIVQSLQRHPPLPN